MTSIKFRMMRLQAELWAKRERGASALEWALIAAIAVAAAVLIGGVVLDKIREGSTRVSGTVIPGGNG